MVEEEKKDKEEEKLEELEGGKRNSSLSSLWDDIMDNLRFKIKKERFKKEVA